MKINNQDEETFLYTVVYFGFAELVVFYVEYGVIVDSVNVYMEILLVIVIYWVFRFKEQEYSRDYYFVCRMLFDYNVEVNVRDDDFKFSFYKVVWNCDYVFMYMMLEVGVEVNFMDINGCVVIQYVLKVIFVRFVVQFEICY